MQETKIAVIDMKAFYASVECVERGLNPFTTPLVVCDTSRGNGTIVLSVSPFLKNMGVPSRCRKRELPEIEGMIYAVPRMSLYLKKSAEIVSIVLDFVGEDDIHVYSIDELFINLGPYLKMYDMTPYKLVKKIKDTIYEKMSLPTTAGISENMLLAKLALDLDAKKRPPYISQWKKSDVKTKLWPLKPLSKMWGISLGYERKLNNMGMFSVGQLATADKNLLKKEFGVMGEQLWEHANGIDNTNIRVKYVPKETSLSLGQVLFRDYKVKEVETIIREMNDDLSTRLREQEKLTGVVGLMIGYSMDVHRGFSRQMALDLPTDDTDILLNALLKIYREYVEDYPIRRVYLSFGKLMTNKYEQLSLFEDNEKLDKQRKLQKTLDKVKSIYGKDAVSRGSSLLEESTAKERHNQIGGHRK